MIAQETDRQIPDRMWVGGEWTGSADGRTFPIDDPATGDVLAEVPNATEADIRRAVDAAAEAFATWSHTSARQRGDILRRAADLMVADRDRLGRLLTREQGKPIGEGIGEIDYAAGFLSWFSGEAERVYGATIPSPNPSKRILVLRQPAGVAAAITPWNFPAAMLTRKVAPALAAGCTVVAKPSRATPLSALAVGEILEAAGCPAGVVNIVTTTDSRAFSDLVFADGRVRVVSFTGSTEVGRELMRGAAENIVELSLELGGHAPFLVFDDADVDAAIQGAIASKFRNGGQTCICANRILVQRGIAERFVDRLVGRIEALKVGSGLDPAVQIGPMIDERAVEKIERHVEDAVRRGARIVAGGRRLPDLGTRFYQPTLLLDVTPEMLVMQEETFGPVAVVATFGSEEEGIRAANATPYGLAAYFYTRDYARLTRVAEALDYGIIGANDALPSTPVAPFGGVKQSGLGREGGFAGIHEFLDVKYISIGGIGS